MVKREEGRYNSTYGFVTTNKLEKEAEECFGKNWEAEDDVNQIQRLLKYLKKEDLIVSLIENLNEDDILITKFEPKKIALNFNAENINTMQNIYISDASESREQIKVFTWTVGDVEVSISVGEEDLDE